MTQRLLELNQWWRLWKKKKKKTEKDKQKTRILLFAEHVSCLKCLSKYPPYFTGYYMEARDCPGAALRNSTLNDQKLVCCILDTAPVSSQKNVTQNIIVSFETYLDLVGETTRTRALYPFYKEALHTAEMWSKHEIAAFTAQVC